MITGFNSDIEHDGKVFHVQTEEKGPDNPIVITLVYCGGQIVTSIKASYADLVDEEEEAAEADIRRRMSEQHLGLIRDIRRGKFTPVHLPFGHELITDRSFDELVIDYLEESIGEASARTGRVLHRLERLLSAAQKAQIEQECPEEAAEVEAPEETAEAAEPSAAVPEQTRRTPRWIWALAAAAMIVAATALFLLKSPGGVEIAPRLSSVPVAPASGSVENTAEERTGLRASASSVVSTPPPAEEPDPAIPVSDDTSPEPLDPPPRPAKAPATTPPPATPPEEAEVREDRPASEESPPTEPAEVIADPVVTPEDTIVPPTPADPVPTDAVADPPESVDEADVPPMARQRDLPRYTRRARRLQQEGEVKLRIRIDSYGEVDEVILVEGIPESDLNEAAVEVAGGWTFSPARRNGESVDVWKDVTFEFTVRPDRTTSVRIRE